MEREVAHIVSRVAIVDESAVLLETTHQLPLIVKRQLQLHKPRRCEQLWRLSRTRVFSKQKVRKLHPIRHFHDKGICAIAAVPECPRSLLPLHSIDLSLEHTAGGTRKSGRISICVHGSMLAVPRKQILLLEVWHFDMPVCPFVAKAPETD